MGFVSHAMLCFLPALTGRCFRATTAMPQQMCCAVRACFPRELSSTPTDVFLDGWSCHCFFMMRDVSSWLRGIVSTEFKLLLGCDAEEIVPRCKGVSS